jgi:hypothetical protein
MILFGNVVDKNHCATTSLLVDHITLLPKAVEIIKTALRCILCAHFRTLLFTPKENYVTNHMRRESPRGAPQRSHDDGGVRWSIVHAVVVPYFWC